MGKYIDKTYLTSLWGRIKQIPEKVSYTINNASKTLVDAINDLYTGKANKEHTHLKSSIMDFPTSLPANGGDADTVDGKHAGDFALAGSSFTKDESYIYNGCWSAEEKVERPSATPRTFIYKLYLFNKDSIYGASFNFDLHIFGIWAYSNTQNEEVIQYQGGIDASYSGFASRSLNAYNYSRRLTSGMKDKNIMPNVSDICYDPVKQKFFVYIVAHDSNAFYYKVHYKMPRINGTKFEPFINFTEETDKNLEITTFYGETVSLSNNRYKYDCVTKVDVQTVNGSSQYKEKTDYYVYSSTPNPSTLDDYNITDACSQADFTALDTQVNGTGSNDGLASQVSLQQTDILNIKQTINNTVMLKAVYLDNSEEVFTLVAGTSSNSNNG